MYMRKYEEYIYIYREREREREREGPALGHLGPQVNMGQ